MKKNNVECARRRSDSRFDRFIQKPALSLLSILSIATFFAFFNYRGIDFSDEYVYARHAWQIANGTFELTPSVFNNRFGILLPLAGLVRLFGAHAPVFTLWSFACFIILLCANYYFVRLCNNRVAFFSTLFLALNPALLELSADVSQDLVMTCFSTISVFLLWQTQNQPSRASFFRGALFSTMLFVAFATKMSVFYLGPFLLYFLVSDLLKKQNFPFWRGAVLSGGALLFVYFYLYYLYTGDPFYRINGIEGEYNALFDSYGRRPEWEFWARMTIFPIPFLLKSYGTGIFAMVGALWIFRFDYKKTDSLPHFCFLWLFSLLVIHWFGSTSLQYYNPIILSERMWLLVIPPAVLLATFTIENLLPGLTSRQQKLSTIFFIGIAGLCGVGLILGGRKYPWFSLPLVVGTLATIWLWRPFPSNKKAGFYALMFLPLLWVQAGNIVQYKKNTPYFYQYTFLQSLPENENHLVYSDPNFAAMFDIYFKFNAPKHLHYKSWYRADTSDLQHFDRFYVVRDKIRQTWTEGFRGHPTPDFAKNDHIGQIILDNKIIQIKALTPEEVKSIKPTPVYE
ncbi:MAG: hypothetical protein D6714_13585 [Bacteroidetes bacterium]|nr:MAG: hypothetical protein D6714_13585 [Bacteroidota bacterium]